MPLAQPRYAWEGASMRLVGFTLVMLAVLSGSCSAAPARPLAARVDHAALDSVLAAHVRPDGVDYEGLREHSLGTLTRYLDAMARVNAMALPKRERDAFEINLYNATMLRAVCDRLAPGWTPASDDFAVFKAPLVRLKNRNISLNQLENDVIRPRIRDPRVHVALNCAAKSCPPLQPRAYRAATLDSMLDANMSRFVRDPRHNTIDASKRRMRLSRLFDWYAADFGGVAAVPVYVAKRLALPTSGWSVEYIDYDWSLAASGGAPGR